MMKASKHLIMALLAGLLFLGMGCSKEEGEAPTPQVPEPAKVQLLKGISLNGSLIAEYTYNANKTISRYDYLGSLRMEFTYQTNSSQVEKIVVTRFNPASSSTFHYTYTGTVPTRIDISGDGTSQEYVTLQYNSDKQLQEMVRYTATGEVKHRSVLHYSAEKDLQTFEYYAGSSLQDRYTFSGWANKNPFYVLQVPVPDVNLYAITDPLYPKIWSRLEMKNMVSNQTRIDQYSYTFDENGYPTSRSKEGDNQQLSYTYQKL